MTQCQFCGCQKVAYQWFGGTFIFTCGTWSGSTSIRGDRCYENEIAALKMERDTLAAGVLAADWLMTPAESSTILVFDDKYDTACAERAAALKLALELRRRIAVKEDKQ
jgi:hypothetical protein